MFEILWILTPIMTVGFMMVIEGDELTHWCICGVDFLIIIMTTNLVDGVIVLHLLSP